MGNRLLQQGDRARVLVATSVAATAGALLAGQARGDTTLPYGATAITANAGTTLNLGAITRAGQSTVDFTPLAGATITTTTPNASPANGVPTILGGYATFNGGETWAISGAAGGVAGALSGLNSYSTAFAADANVNVPSGTTTAPAAATVNTLRLAAGSAELFVIDTLQVSGGGILVAPSFGAATASFTGGTLTGSPAEMIVHQYAADSRLMVGSTIADRAAGTAMNLIKTGPGTLVLSGANTYSGVTAVWDGVLEVPEIGMVGTPSPLGTGNSAPGSASVIALTGGTLRYTGGSTTTDWRLFNAALQSDPTIEVVRADANLDWSGTITTTGSRNLRKTGPGTLTLSGVGDNHSATFDVVKGTLVLAKTSSDQVHATGGTRDSIVRSGATLRLAGTGGDQVFIYSGMFLEPGGTFDLNGRSETIGHLGGGGVVTSSAGTGPRTVRVVDFGGAGNPVVPFSGVVEDGPSGQTGITIGEQISGLPYFGTLVLSGPNSYTGPTTIFTGTLKVLPGGRIGSPMSTADVTVLSRLELMSDGISDLATLRITGSTFRAPVAISAGVSDLIGSLVLDGKTFGPGIYGSTASGAANNFSITSAGLNPNNYFSGNGVVVVVPEPGTAGVLGLFAMTAVLRRRRR